MTTTHYHFEDPLGEDRTLCGLADDGGVRDVWGENPEFEPPYYHNGTYKVTCPECLKIIVACFNYANES